MPFDWMLVCFRVFILIFGATQALKVWTIWHGGEQLWKRFVQAVSTKIRMPRWYLPPSAEMRTLEKLALRHKRRVLAAAQRITNNREDAEDVLQESFYRAFVHLGDFQEKSLFSTWLIRIAVNQALMLLRRRRRIAEVLPETCDDAAKSVSEIFVDQVPNPEQS